MKYYASVRKRENIKDHIAWFITVVKSFEPTMNNKIRITFDADNCLYSNDYVDNYLYRNEADVNYDMIHSSISDAMKYVFMEIFK